MPKLVSSDHGFQEGLNRRMHLYTFFDFDGHRIADNIEHKYQPKYLYKAESKRSQTLRFSSAPASWTSILFLDQPDRGNLLRPGYFF